MVIMLQPVQRQSLIIIKGFFLSLEKLERASQMCQKVWNSAACRDPSVSAILFFSSSLIHLQTSQFVSCVQINEVATLSADSLGGDSGAIEAFYQSLTSRRL